MDNESSFSQPPRDASERVVVVDTPNAKVEIVFCTKDYDGREREVVTVCPKPGCVSDGTDIITVRSLPEDRATKEEIRHGMVASQCDDLVYAIVLKRKNGDTPKVCKITDQAFYMTRFEAEKRHMEIGEDIRTYFEVRALYMSFAPPGTP